MPCLAQVAIVTWFACVDPGTERKRRLFLNEINLMSDWWQIWNTATKTDAVSRLFIQDIYEESQSKDDEETDFQHDLCLTALQIWMLCLQPPVVHCSAYKLTTIHIAFKYHTTQSTLYNTYILNVKTFCHHWECNCAILILSVMKKSNEVVDININQLSIRQESPLQSTPCVKSWTSLFLFCELVTCNFILNKVEYKWYCW